MVQQFIQQTYIDVATTNKISRNTFLKAIYSLAAVIYISNSALSLAAEPLQDKLPGNNLGPLMVLLPSGEFMMGSPREEKGRYEDEGPQHRVTFNRPFYMAQTPVTVAQFRTFIKTSGYKTEAEQQEWSEWRNPESGEWEGFPNIDWRHDNRGKLSKDNNPVIHVSWNDAKAYADWLSKVTGEIYRLPSEAEMEYANRGGTTTTYWWGNGNPTQKIANLKGEFDIPENDKTWYPTAQERQYAYAHGYTPFLFKGYGDGYWGISPVATFKSNGFDLYDTAGNVWEWTQDCWNGSYHGAPDDGSAWTSGVCSLRVVRGGSYYCFPRHVRSANRWARAQDYRGMYIGFRVIRENSYEDNNEDDF